jgi:hypothetical protein
VKTPLRNGLPVSPYELDLAPSELDLDNEYNFTNHHWLFVSSIIGQTTLGRVARDLERHQTCLPRDTHIVLHAQYQPPYQSKRDVGFGVVKGMMEAVDEAYLKNEDMRFGSACNPRYVPLSEHLLVRCMIDYQWLKEQLA